MNANAVFGNLDTIAAAAADAASADRSVVSVDSTEAPTTIPCGITISITLDC